MSFAQAILPRGFLRLFAFSPFSNGALMPRAAGGGALCVFQFAALPTFLLAGRLEGTTTGADAVAETRSFLQGIIAPELLAMVDDKELERFAHSEAFHVGRCVTCSRHFAHAPNDAQCVAVVLGDAACCFRPCGQGINAALESAMQFDQALRAARDDVHAAAKAFSHSRKPDTDALLAASKLQGWRAVATNALAKILGTLTLHQAKADPQPYANLWLPFG